MEDTADRPFAYALNQNGELDIRTQFITQMRNLAYTIKASPAGSNIVTVLTPFLSMSGLTGLIPRLNSSVLVDVLEEAANEVERLSDAQAVIFGYYLDGNLTLVVFNFTNANISQKQIPLNIPMDTVAGELFLSTTIKNNISTAAIELSAIPLWKVTSVLCGTKV